MIGWMTDVAEADTYFNKRVSDAEWRNLDETKKEAALTHAYNRIYYHKDYTIPASPTDAQLAALKIAQCETANYLVIHLADEDRRKGIQVQGVKQAGIVKETYSEEDFLRVPLPPSAIDVLLDFYKYGDAMAMIPIDRDEDENMSTDVVEED